MADEDERSIGKAEEEEMKEDDNYNADMSELTQAEPSGSAFQSVIPADSLQSIEELIKTQSISYQEPPRINELEWAFDFETSSPDIQSLFVEEVEEVEEAQKEESRTSMCLYRPPIYKKHQQLEKSLDELRLINNIIQKKLAVHFRRRQMEYVIKDVEVNRHEQNKYRIKLKAYGALLKQNEELRTFYAHELSSLRQKRDTQRQTLEVKFKSMQEREASVGYGLIHTKTGKPIPDKLVTRQLGRQTLMINAISDKRLQLLKLQQLIQEKRRTLQKKNEIAPNCFLNEYESLKASNRELVERIEEKDEEMCKLRHKFNTTIQIIAHYQTKSVNLEEDLHRLREEIDEIQELCKNIRSELNQLKQQQSDCRRQSNVLKDELGISAMPELLQDMQNGIKEYESLSLQLQSLKDEYEKCSSRICHYKQRSEKPRRKKVVYRPDITVDSKPSMACPEIHVKALENLITIKPQSCKKKKIVG